jgi:hypothetical protein
MWTELAAELRPASSPTQICAVGVTGFSQFAVTAAESALPVELVGFSAQQDGRAVRLVWQTTAETNNAGFHVERRDRGDWAALSFVEGRGTTETSHSYRFADTTLPFTADSLTYRLRQVDLDGTETFSDEVVVSFGEPDRIVLHAPYPNPVRGPVTGGLYAALILASGGAVYFGANVLLEAFTFALSENPIGSGPLVLNVLPLIIAIYVGKIAGGVFERTVTSLKVIYFTIFYTQITHDDRIADELKPQLVHYLRMEEEPVENPASVRQGAVASSQ